MGVNQRHNTRHSHLAQAAATNTANPDHAENHPDFTPVGPASMIDRTSYIRLIEQSLRSLGYEDVAVALEAASNVQQSSVTATRFREAVLGGEVDAALGLLGELEGELVEKEVEVEGRRRDADGGVVTVEAGTGQPGSRTLDLGSIRRRVQRRVDQARYLLFCNMFRTLVEAGEAGKALKCLREDIQPLESVLGTDGEHGGASMDRQDVEPMSSMQEDVDMGVSGFGDALQQRMDTLRDTVGVTFGDFPMNFGVQSAISRYSTEAAATAATTTTTAPVTNVDYRGTAPPVTTAAIAVPKASGGSVSEASPPSLSALASMLLQANRGAPPLPPKRLREYSDVDVRRQEQLLRELQHLLSPEVLIPDNRLETLVEQALTSQIKRCPYHNASNAALSLMSDYQAGPESLPTVPVHTLTLHADEVWVVQFSPDGKWLVSASKDGSAILWDVQSSRKVVFSRILHSGRVPINIGAFSPTSQEVLIGSNDGKVRIFKVSTGDLLAELTAAVGSSPLSPNPNQDTSISSAMWGNSSSRIALSCNKELRMIDIDITVPCEPFVPKPIRVNSVRLQNHAYDSVLSADGGTFVSVGQDRMLRYVRVSDRKVVTRGPEPAAVTCLSRSSDGRFLASNLANGCIHIWQLGDLSHRDTEGRDVDMRDSDVSTTLSAPTEPLPDPMESLPARPLFVLKGLETSQPGRFVIRSAFGGVGDAFVGTGSENALVHIWHRETETLLASVEGHQATVNAVAWNPRNHHMLASASDDHKVIIWLSTKHLASTARGE